VHQPPSLIHQVTTLICCLRLVAQSMYQQPLARIIGRVGTPVAECAAEPVCAQITRSILAKCARGCAANWLVTGPASERPRMLAQGRVIDHVIGVSGAQVIEEVQSALAGPRGEPGEAVVANLGAEANSSAA
jgi:hypothetical protein